MLKLLLACNAMNRLELGSRPRLTRALAYLSRPSPTKTATRPEEYARELHNQRAQFHLFAWLALALVKPAPDPRRVSCREILRNRNSNRWLQLVLVARFARFDGATARAPVSLASLRTTAFDYGREWKFSSRKSSTSQHKGRKLIDWRAARAQQSASSTGSVWSAIRPTVASLSRRSPSLVPTLASFAKSNRG